jgi:predicted dehydrogenase
MESKPLRYAMIGGGIGSFMGPVHRTALAMTGLAVPAGGMFSRNAEKNRAAARGLGLPEDRAYPDIDALLAAKDADGLDFAVIVSRSAYHCEQVKRCLIAGLPVVCDKPVCVTPEEGRELLALQQKTGLACMVTYTYSGYPMLGEARERIRRGELGDVRVVAVQYQQDWMVRRYEQAEDKSLFWRTDPGQTGPSCCVADIGVHVAYIAKFLTGEGIASLAAGLHRFTDGMPLDDNAFIWTRMGRDGRIKGQYWCSQVAVGRHNQIRVNVSGSRGSNEWNHVEPDILRLYRVGEPEMILKRNDPAGLSAFSRSRAFLMPLEHPEGTLEAFAVLYRAFCRGLAAGKAGRAPDPADIYPSLRDGVEGAFFVDRCLASSRADSAWVEFPPL